MAAGRAPSPGELGKGLEHLPVLFDVSVLIVGLERRPHGVYENNEYLYCRFKYSPTSELWKCFIMVFSSKFTLNLKGHLLLSSICFYLHLINSLGDLLAKFCACYRKRVGISPCTWAKRKCCCLAPHINYFAAPKSLHISVLPRAWNILWTGSLTCLHIPLCFGGSYPWNLSFQQASQ